MKDMKNMMITDEALEEVLGGEIVRVQNAECGYANVRHEPGLNGRIAARIENGTKLNTTGETVDADGYTWYEVTLVKGPDNRPASEEAWIAGSLIGY